MKINTFKRLIEKMDAIENKVDVIMQKLINGNDCKRMQPLPVKVYLLVDKLKLLIQKRNILIKKEVNSKSKLTEL
jgi:hypothetical protein